MKSRVGLLFALILALLAAQPAFAQDSAWGEVVNRDGSINYAGMTDNGVVTQPADFMPTIPGVGKLDAQYHSYTTESGNQVLMPSATTLLFMATDSSSMLYTNPAMGTTPIGISAAETSQGNALVGIAAVGNVLSGDIQSGAQYDTNFFDSVVSGEQNIWEVAPSGIGNLFWDFMTVSVQDMSLYTYMILVPAETAVETEELSEEEVELILEPTAPPPTEPPSSAGKVTCPPPLVIPGKITFDGGKTAPNYPLVVGQDPSKRGVDFAFSAEVAPTRYITYKLIPEYSCEEDCKDGDKRVITGYHCQKNVEKFEECIDSASGILRLGQTSREWILKELSVRYPEAYLHHPEFSFSSGGGCAWAERQKNVPVADPGHWDVYVRGVTSGTPVSGPRSFGGKTDTFEDWLKEIAIIK